MTFRSSWPRPTSAIRPQPTQPYHKHREDEEMKNCLDVGDPGVGLILAVTANALASEALPLRVLRPVRRLQGNQSLGATSTE